MEIEPDDISDIETYYSRNQESHRFNSHALEFFVTLRILNKYLHPKVRVLELGAGPGFFTVHLAGEAHTVHATDLSPALLELNRKVISDLNLGEKVTHQVLDARDLSVEQVGKFNAVLNMGPMYHLIQSEERALVLKRISPCIEPGGFVFNSFLTRSGYLSYILSRQPQLALTSPQQILDVMEKGFVSQHPRDGSFRGYYTSVEAAVAQVENAGFKIIGVHSQDPAIGGVDELFNRLPQELKNAWADILFSRSHERDFLGSGRTIMVVGQKP